MIDAVGLELYALWARTVEVPRDIFKSVADILRPYADTGD
jgi:hypothetical protein